MVASRNFSTLNYLYLTTKVCSASLRRCINLLLDPDIKVAFLCLFTFLFVYLLVSDLYLHEIRTFNIFYAGELWLTLWRVMAQALQAALHYYSTLFLQLNFFTHNLFRVISG